MRKYLLGDIATLKYGKMPDKAKIKAYGYPIFSGYRVVGYTDEFHFEEPQLIVVARGVGGTGDVKLSPPKAYITNLSISIVLDETKADKTYLFYYFQKNNLRYLDSGSAQSQITINDLRRLEIEVPDIHIQREIARVLKTIDDKIELNHQINQTLEQMARAIFKSWFIDFDPVKAKAEGKKPFGMDDATAALFPNSFEDSEIGPIPTGWQQGSVGDLFTNIRETVSPDSLDESTNYIALDHMPRGSINLENWTHSAAVESQKARFKTNDVLFGKLRPYFKKVGFAQIDGVCSTDILVLRPKHTNLFAFGLLHTSSDRCIDFVNARSDGTRMPRTSWKDIAQFSVIIPPSPVLDVFAHTTQTFWQMIEHNSKESKTLKTTRDLLLPRLISGELSIQEAQ
jgi:type I restriction enzyme S subunit